MFISREEKEKLNSEIVALKRKVSDLEEYANALTGLFKEEIDKRMKAELQKATTELVDTFAKMTKNSIAKKTTTKRRTGNDKQIQKRK